jgi:tetratricopeptide (TPR) repeat protein
VFIDDTNRKIIPRWRDFITTAALGELASEERRDENSKNLYRVQSFETICGAWIDNKTLWHALDLVSAALVDEETARPEVREAAAFITQNAADCPPAGLAVARRVLNPELYELSATDDHEVTVVQLRKDIHAQRGRLDGDPRNSVVWIDLARLYTIAGQHEKALHAIEVAYKQQPQNRFVLRSASRFFVHIGEHDRALRVLRSSEIVSVDPWLAAAEIGVSEFVGRPSKLVKPAKILLADDSVSSFMGSELASALGTLELKDGNSKLAKRLFQRSLAAPTENSLAQAEWATKQIASLENDVSVSHAPRNYEAKAIHGFRSGDWNSVRENTLRWLRDQPFSSRPAGLLSYIYSEILDNYADAEKILRVSLKSNPGDRLLTNNLVYVLINLGRLDEADRILADVDPRAVNDISSLTLVATLGLFFFRKGEFQRGVFLYRDAIEQSRHKHLVRYEALAAIHLARETILAKLPGSEETLKEAGEIAQRVPDADVTFLLSKVQDLQHKMATENSGE